MVDEDDSDRKTRRMLSRCSESREELLKSRMKTVTERFSTLKKKNRSVLK